MCFGSNAQNNSGLTTMTDTELQAKLAERQKQAKEGYGAEIGGALTATQTEIKRRSDAAIQAARTNLAPDLTDKALQGAQDQSALALRAKAGRKSMFLSGVGPGGY